METKTISGRVLAVGQPKKEGDGYGLRIDYEDDVCKRDKTWYNSEPGETTDLEKGINVTLRIKKEDGKWRIVGIPNITEGAEPPKKPPTPPKQEDKPVKTNVVEVRKNQIEHLKSCAKDTKEFMNWLSENFAETDNVGYAITPTIVFDNLARVRLRHEYYEIKNA